MKLIESSVSIIDIADPFIKIETAGRTCYKSESAMTAESARKFYHNLASRGHTAMLEHATFCFEVNQQWYEYLYGYKYLNYSVEEFADGRNRYLISGNLRAINDTMEQTLLRCLYSLDPDLVYHYSPLFRHPISPDYPVKIVDIDSIPDIQGHAYRKHKYLTFHFICDRGVTHEIVRHRPASYAQESTRYCNYSKDKFGNEITFILPANYDQWSPFAKSRFRRALKTSEEKYMSLLKEGLTPQEARAVLPNALKTEIIMTANCEEFDHFFDLRSRGVTGAPHPDMKVVADKALVLYEENIKKQFC